jgi:hypothetical protein
MTTKLIGSFNLKIRIHKELESLEIHILKYFKFNHEPQVQTAKGYVYILLDYMRDLHYINHLSPSYRTNFVSRIVKNNHINVRYPTFIFA